MSINEEKLISIGQINFLNCLPVNYSFRTWGLENIVLSDGYPSLINQLMEDQQIHIAPISSIEYLKNQDKYSLIDTISISSFGEAGSVVLFSNFEFNELEGKKIGIPYTSATSIALLKVLLQENKINLNNVKFSLHKYETGLDEMLKGDYDAVLFIGDPALVANIQYQDKFLKYDLGKLWFDKTGYPMVFGTWVAQSDWKICYGDDFDRISFLLNKAVDAGLNMYLNEIIELAAESLKLEKIHIKKYLRDNINYTFTDQHKHSLKLFQNFYFNLEKQFNYSGVL